MNRILIRTLLVVTVYCLSGVKVYSQDAVSLLVAYKIGRDMRERAYAEYIDNYQKFEVLRANGGISYANSSLAKQYIEKCIYLNNSFGATGNFFGDRGDLAYKKSLVYHAQSDTYNEYIWLKTAISYGYNTASGSYYTLLTKVGTEQFEPIIYNVIDAMKAYVDGETATMSPSVMQNLNSCIALNAKYDGNLCDWGNLYYLKSCAYTNIYGNTEESLNYLLMALNKNNDAANDMKEMLLAKDVNFDDGMLSPNVAYGTYAINVINPVVRKTTKENTSCRINRVYVTNDKTIIELTYINRNSGWMNISPNTYISAGGKSYNIIGARGIPFSPDKYYFKSSNEVASFFLIFPAIPTTTKKISLIESKESSWQFKGIRLQ